MKKKIIIVLGIIVLIAILLFVMYKVDMHMMENNKPVIFSTWGYDYVPPEKLGGAVEIVDKTLNSNLTFDTALEKIFEDEKNMYFLNCIKSNYIIVKYESGYEEDIKTSLKSGRITINDLDRFSINYIANKKQVEYENSFIGVVLEETDSYVLVRPNENETERHSSDKIVVRYIRDKNTLFGVKNTVIVCYNGGIMESYPAMINEASVSVLD